MTHRGRVLAVGSLIALLLLTALLPGYGSALGRAAVLHTGAPSTLRPTGAPTASLAAVPHVLAPHGLGGVPPATGRGEFFRTSDEGLVPSTHRTCFSGTCVNVTDDPSLNLTTQGILAVAYTEYTDASPCAAMAASALSEVGVRTSTDGGVTWSNAQVLGNPVCSAGGGQNYPSAWEPSLTSLSNGTLVLAYVEYNVSAVGLSPLPNVAFGPSSWNVNYDRLVVTESYDNGSRWTSPSVLNSSTNPSLNNGSFAPQRPWITATGKTVYLTWMNWTENFGTVFNYTTYTYHPVGFASAAVHLVVSTDGGSTFGSPVTLASTATAFGDYAMNPFVMVEPSGELLVTYATNLTFHPLFDCSNGCFTAVWTVDVVLARSTNNGSTFAYSDAVPNAPVPILVNGPFTDPSPQLAYSPATGQLFLAFTTMRFHPWCTAQYGCLSYEDPAVVVVTNSSTDGATWSTPSVPALADLAELITTSSAFLLPAVAVNATGVLELAMTFVDGSQCQANPPYACRQYEAYLSSSDNGATFTPPVFVTGNSSSFPFIGFGTSYGTISPLGEYATMLTAGGASWFGWTNALCPPGLLPASCNYPSSNGGSGIEVSQPFQGLGVTLTFHPAFLPVGASWQVNLLGNVRQGTGNLGFSGLPVGDNVSWAPLQNVSNGYGVRSSPTTTAASPTTIYANSTISVHFSTQYLFEVKAIPPFTPPPGGIGNYCYSGPIVWDNPSCMTATMNITPMPGANWEAPGTVVPLSVVNTTLYCAPTASCGSTDYANVTFLSWSGAGNGSYSGLSPNANVTVNAPVNETASFQVNGWCYYSYSPPTTPACIPNTQSILFQETGLPAGTNWSVTVSNANQSNTNTSSSSSLVATGSFTSGVAAFSVWSVPAPGGKFWVPTSNPISPVVLPEGSVVQVAFSLQSVTGSSFPLELVANGIPADSNWSYSVDGAVGAVDGSDQVVLNLTGGLHNVSAPALVLANQTAYSLTSAQLIEFVVNQTAQNFTGFPARATLEGPAVFELNFSLAYLLSVEATAGGNVTPSSHWVVPGQGVVLNAVPSTGYYFVGWTGTGPGTVSSQSRQITVSPNGPARELATFAPIPAPTWTVSVVPSGLPPAVLYSVTLGNRTYSGTGSFSIPLLATGSYPLSVPYAYRNSSDLTRFLAGRITPTFPFTGGALTIATNGTIDVDFVTESVVGLSANAGGSVSWSATSAASFGNTSGILGTAWVESGTTVSWSATPNAGFTFVGWSGTGAGSFNSSSLTGSSTVAGPVAESASFAAVPPPPFAGYALTLTPMGLAAGAEWNASVGSTGGTSPGGAVVIAGLNGSYTVVVPPVYVAPGIRYVNSSGSFPVTVHAAVSLNVKFTEEVLLSVTVSAGGNATPGTEWVTVGTTVTITATANATSTFSNWSGTGANAYSGASSSRAITVTGPVDEVASFTPVYPAPSTPAPAASSSGLPISLGLLVALLAVGLVVGLLVGRRRPPRGPSDQLAPEGPESASWEETSPPEDPLPEPEPASTPEYSEQ
ncbi:MAG: hypothetical protein L3K23_02050 [Thermoplasmata archaeon]|nr:hypothetical protein [Thermoplasmata archaeon]